MLAGAVVLNLALGSQSSYETASTLDARGRESPRQQTRRRTGNKGRRKG